VAGQTRSGPSDGPGWPPGMPGDGGEPASPEEGASGLVASPGGLAIARHTGQMPSTPLPPKELLDALAQAAVDNANRLLTDASTLLAAGTAPSAHSLAVLAVEEVGKAIICCGGFAGSDNTVTTRERFDQEIASHSAKLTWARNFVDVMVAMARAGVGDNSGMAASAEEYLEALKEQRKRDNIQKMRGFYVDLSDAGEVQLPAEITVADAEEMISLAGWANRAVRELFIDGTGFRFTVPSSTPPADRRPWVQMPPQD
jgi:AbiV family abortive infection protein